MNFSRGTIIKVIVEYNNHGYMVHLNDYLGSYTRGKSEDIALEKVSSEVERYCKWAGWDIPVNAEPLVIKHCYTNSRIDDGDTEVLLDFDKCEISDELFIEYYRLAMLSAQSLQVLYDSVLDKQWVDISKQRKTFYGDTPCTAEEMIWHVDKVQGYYMSRIGIDLMIIPNEFLHNRIVCLEVLEKLWSNNKTINEFNIDNESWTLLKLLRRFMWHELIHAQALYRLGLKIPENSIHLEDPFLFGITC